MDGISFAIGEFVYLKSDDHAAPYVARIERLFETEAGSKSVCVRWLYRFEECFDDTKMAEGQSTACLLR
jgi:hypothetical protein